MPTKIIVVDNPKRWPPDLAGVELVSARQYLTQPARFERRGLKIFNLCRSYRYQSVGYYVSLLAEARGHRPLPSNTTIQDLKTHALIRGASDELDRVIQSSLRSLKSPTFVLSVYFGRNLAKRYDRLALALFRLFPAPLLRANFGFDPRSGRWSLQGLGAVALDEIPESHRPFLIEAASEHFGGKRARLKQPRPRRFDLAILANPDEHPAPSDERALQRFVRAAERQDIAVEIITKADYGRLAEFDALFIRETTAVNHHTYRFARRAAAEGLVVIDDPVSIVKCTNKVFLAELIERHRLPAPKTLVVHRDNVDEVAPALGLPCILKRPDSSFSQGVIKVETHEALNEALQTMLAKSDLVIAQAFLPTPFDWRIGVLDRKALWACKYHMARDHWQIMQWDAAGTKGVEGGYETLPVEQAPPGAVQLALDAAKLIGDGLYGVDIKEIDGRFYLIEINDNPSLEAGVEDLVLRDGLYDAIIQVFLQRILKAKEAA